MSKFGGDNKTFKAVQFLLNTKEAARRESNYDVRDLEYSDKLRNISVSGDIEDLFKVNLQVLNHAENYRAFKLKYRNKLMRNPVRSQGFRSQCILKCQSFVAE